MGTDNGCLRCSGSVKIGQKYCHHCGFYTSVSEEEILTELVLLNIDVVGFTAMAEKLDIEDTARRLEKIFNPLIYIVEQGGGFINQFLGDEMSIFVGFTGERKRMVERALRISDEIHYFTSIRGGQNGNMDSPFNVQLAMEYGEVILKPHNSDGGIYFITYGEPVERVQRGLKLVRGGETVVGQNIRQKVKDTREAHPISPDETDLFILQSNRLE